MKRVLLNVVPAGSDGRWSVQIDGRTLIVLDDKYSAVREGKDRCAAASSHGVYAQLVIQDSLGNFERHYTYNSALHQSV